MKKFTIYDESTAAPASDHSETDLDYFPRKTAILISKKWDERIVWVLIICAVIGFAIAVWHFRQPEQVDKFWFENNGQIPKDNLK